MRSAARRLPLVRLTAALVALLALAGPARGAEPGPWVLAVVPNQPPVTLHKAWAPFVERLSRDTGLRIQLKLYDRIGAFLEDCDAGTGDLVFAAPNMFFLSHRRQGYVPLVRSQKMLTGVIFVRKDSPYRTIQDLHGKTIAFVGPKNVCSVLTRHALATSGTPVEFNAAFTGSTVNVAKSVLLGKADAGATLDGVFAKEMSDAVDGLRTILETPPVAPHPLAAHPRVPVAVRERITAAVLAMAQTEDGRLLLDAVRLASPMRADFDRDYRAFDAVDFERLERQEH